MEADHKYRSLQPGLYPARQCAANRRRRLFKRNSPEVVQKSLANADVPASFHLGRSDRADRLQCAEL
ncbi:hypothetical protein D1872_266730 [compost metagenome]